MSILSSLADYGRAIQTAASYQGLNLLHATHSVLRAKMKYGIGPRFHSLFELGSKPEAAWSEYLIDEPLKVHLRAINPAPARVTVDDKLLFLAHCKNHNIETIPLVCAIDRSKNSACPELQHAHTKEDWTRLILAGPDEIFIKLINGSWGQDAFLAQRNEGYWHFCDRRGDSAALYDFCLQRLGGRRGWIVQPRLYPHPALQRVMATHALGTLRIVTVLDTPSTTRLLFAVLRMPVGRNLVDNFVHGASGNLIAAVEQDSGRLHRARGSSSLDWPVMRNVDDHPETRNRITDFIVPLWRETAHLVLQVSMVTAADGFCRRDDQAA